MAWIIENLTTHTLVTRHRRYAMVSPTYYFGDGTVSKDVRYRAFILRTSEADTFPTLQQAKDWAQAVSLLNH